MIQPLLLEVTLGGAGVVCGLAAWITDYLTNRPQYVGLQNCESNVVVCKGSPGHGAIPLLIHSIHIRLQTQHRQLSPPDVIG